MMGFMKTEIAAQHHQFVMGAGNVNTQMIMNKTGATIIFPDPASSSFGNDSPTQPIPLMAGQSILRSKSTVIIQGSFDSVCLAWQELLVSKEIKLWNSVYLIFHAASPGYGWRISFREGAPSSKYRLLFFQLAPRQNYLWDVIHLICLCRLICVRRQEESLTNAATLFNCFSSVPILFCLIAHKILYQLHWMLYSDVN